MFCENNREYVDKFLSLLPNRLWDRYDIFQLDCALGFFLRETNTEDIIGEKYHNVTNENIKKMFKDYNYEFNFTKEGKLTW